MKLSCRLLLSLSLPLLLASCGLLQVRGDAKRHYAFTVITGQVTTPADWQGGVSIAAITADEEAPRVVHRIWLHEPGGYELIVPPGRYTVEAVADADNRGSPASSLKAASSLIAVHDSGVITQVDLVLQRSPRVLAHDPIAISARHSTQAGALAGLGSPLLSSASGRQGYWTPVETFQQIGGNVYFLSPYDPGRIPVLFVHGAQGSGADWRHLALTLGDEYQPWIFQYPSGASLEAMSHLLYWKLLNLRMRYGFSRLHMVAHSMGGLVVRRFLIDHGTQFPEISAFVSLSTPWGGDARASAGVAHSPVIVPSWRDMQPQGAFLQDLFARPLPPHVRHALVFGYRGASLADLTGDDGVVSLASQLRDEAGAGAWQVIGHDEDHASILSSPVVRDTIRIALADDDGDPAATPQRASLHVRLRGLDTAHAELMPWLLASPAHGREAGPKLLPLQRNANGFHINLPAGHHLLQPLIPGYRTAMKDVVLSSGDEERNVVFDVVPQGLLVARLYRQGALALPSGARAPDAAAPKGAYIQLEGPGVHRSLRMGGDTEHVTLLHAWSRGDDAAGQGWFGFAGLPAGTYRITAHVPGHAPRHSEHQVVLGRPGPVMSLQVVPETPPRR